MNWIIYVIGLTVSCVLAVILTPLVKKFAVWFGAIDVPNHRSVHTRIMPRMGGLAIFLAFVATFFIISPALNDFDTHVVLGLILGGAIIVFVGALDDKYNLSPKIKLAGQLAAAGVVIAFGMQIDYIKLPFGDAIDLNSWISIPITIFWIVGVTNAINLIDGLDGLSAGVSAIATSAILVLAIMMGNLTVIVISLILLGSIVGFLFYNFHPAKIFMGDSGSLFLGFSLATLSILGFKSATIVSFLVPLAILGVPISDTLMAIIRRKLNKKPIFTADKGHLHHCLMGLGFSMRKTVLIIYGISLAFGLCAVLLTKASQWGAIVIVVVLLLVMEVGAEAIGIISKSRKPVLRLLRRLLPASVRRTSK
ncbi:phospho-N-acetylmuramoyl-pentapeptide-transferase [Chlamydia abortus]|uniref:MraY family glycosyltransferase n=1 Tax=Paenibacillus residui TaxID=629724 RepID=A0ABW3DB77_9BACL|nr:MULTISPECIES: MraY family glycosyltransferase [Paenibacillaceae]SHE11352.1 phospho-N-acetylmuramoyl-pentapeptide-transferase [Chlamydia abortus]